MLLSRQSLCLSHVSSNTLMSCAVRVWADIKTIGKLERSRMRNESNLVFTHHAPVFQLTCVIFSYVSRSNEDLCVCALVGRRRETVL